jgi:hypothetical protein
VVQIEWSSGNFDAAHATSLGRLASTVDNAIADFVALDRVSSQLGGAPDGSCGVTAEIVPDMPQPPGWNSPGDGVRLRRVIFQRIAMFRNLPALAVLSFAVAACTFATQSHPVRTATEELLISSAADRATEGLSLKISKGAKVFVDATNFDAFDGYSGKYAIGTIRDRILKQGAHLVDTKAAADTVVEIRAGALSTDEKDFLIGIPSFNLPVPFAGATTFPKIALYENQVEEGVAKFAATSYATKDDTIEAASDPQFGYSHDAEKTVLIFFSWKSNDTVPALGKDPKKAW